MPFPPLAAAAATAVALRARSRLPPSFRLAAGGLEEGAPARPHFAPLFGSRRHAL